MGDAFLAGIAQAFSWQAILANLLGVVTGIIVGAMPGLTYSMGIILLLPFTFVLPPIPAMAVLLGVYIGGMTGGSVSAVLLGIPGTPSAAATVLDGHPMARQGQAGKALGMALLASIFGGLFSLVVLMVLAPQIARIALRFGSPEIFALVLFGLSTICGVSSGSVVKGLIAGTIGLLLMTVGLDPIMGVQRYTFGRPELLSGVDMLAAMIGMFAIPQIIKDVLDLRNKDGCGDSPGLDTRVSAALPSLPELARNFWTMIRSALIGTGIGSIPGTGGPIAAFLAYDQAKRFSREPEKFGTGVLAGIAAPETANNAVTGGALIPMLTLGIPGDPATAILLGGLLIHGLRPGPLLFRENLTVVYGIFLTILIANILTLIVQFYGIRLFVKVLSVPKTYLLPIIVVLCAVGAFAVNNNVFDLKVMAFFGMLGFFLDRYGFPTTPVILALVLGPTLEGEFRRSLIMSKGDLTVFITHPISLAFIILTVLLLVGPAVAGAVRRRQVQA